eukprot:TRINITY_DN464_c0_g1::TRINITY_DN464_c0_g1_i1::g.2476::m.2476 TRINITY_DN464_c0_g1::TRINITY_DN464_c0_g1_i1::g.2476  ORF type:complete len:308 (-),score=54.11,zf-GRF/PF06839.7/0.0044,zf-GRF/PF06839.7/3.2e+02 TRINITY_DN464_c0_g1_i1:741-1625(-)
MSLSLRLSARYFLQGCRNLAIPKRNFSNLTEESAKAAAATATESAAVDPFADVVAGSSSAQTAAEQPRAVAPIDGKCACGAAIVEKRSRTPRNPGRLFRSCSNMDCKQTPFEWLEDPRPSKIHSFFEEKPQRGNFGGNGFRQGGGGGFGGGNNFGNNFRQGGGGGGQWNNNQRPAWSNDGGYGQPQSYQRYGGGGGGYGQQSGSWNNNRPQWGNQGGAGGRAGGFRPQLDSQGFEVPNKNFLAGPMPCPCGGQLYDYFSQKKNCRYRTCINPMCSKKFTWIDPNGQPIASPPAF